MWFGWYLCILTVIILRRIIFHRQESVLKQNSRHHDKTKWITLSQVNSELNTIKFNACFPSRGRGSTNNEALKKMWSQLLYQGNCHFPWAFQLNTSSAILSCGFVFHIWYTSPSKKSMSYSMVWWRGSFDRVVFSSENTHPLEVAW